MSCEQDQWNKAVQSFLRKHDDDEILRAIDIYRYEDLSNPEVEGYLILLYEEKERRGLI